MCYCALFDRSKSKYKRTYRDLLDQMCPLVPTYCTEGRWNQYGLIRYIYYFILVIHSNCGLIVTMDLFHIVSEINGNFGQNRKFSPPFYI